MTEQFKAATIRALYGAILTSGLVLVTTFQTVRSGEDALLAGAASFLGYMIARGAAEGIIDSSRGPTKADVGQ